MDFSFHCVDAGEHRYLWTLVFFVKEGTHLVELGVLRVGFGELRNVWCLVTKV